jgi:hypothetical protein
MRTVAKFQFRTSVYVPQAAESVSAIVDAWAEAKFSQKGDGSTIITVSGKDALFERDEAVLDGNKLIRFKMLEPVEGGQLQTEIGVLGTPDFTAFRCSLRLGSDTGLSRPAAEIRSPRFIRNVVNAELPWRVGKGGERVFAHAFDVSSEEVETLENLTRLSP